MSHGVGERPSNEKKRVERVAGRQNGDENSISLSLRGEMYVHSVLANQDGSDRRLASDRGER